MTSIILNNLNLDFPVYTHHSRSFKSSVINKVLGGLIEDKTKSGILIKALKNISINIVKGDRVGIVGHNGSGKTSLLRVISGVYKNHSGTIQVTGSIASLIDISLGMDPEATGFENIRLRGVLMGMKVSEIKSIESEIAEFSELGEYLHFPLRSYSTGMQMRLSFAISTTVRAQILIMDEWLSVGDERFQNKAEKRLHELITADSILILASHSKDLIMKTCNRVIRLEHGQLEEIPIASL
jgi:lipopolysaccharide transport system ATP-binding protein